MVYTAVVALTAFAFLGISFFVFHPTNSKSKKDALAASIFIETNHPLNLAERSKICVVGGGIGGASAVYTLRSVLPHAEFLLLEAESTVGGRVKSFRYSNSVIEAGAAIIHGSNILFKFYAENVLKYPTFLVESQSFSIYNGGFVFEKSKNSLVSTVWLLYKYGIDLYKLSSFVNSLLEKFDDIYVLLHQKLESFNTPSDLWRAVGLFDLTQETLEEYLVREVGLSKAFISELSDAINRCNYGQSSASLNALAGMVSLSTTSAGASLWRVKEGNQRVVEGLFDITNTTLHLNEAAERIMRLPDGRWAVDTTQLATYECDYVIVAAPLFRVIDDHEGKAPVRFVLNNQDSDTADDFNRIFSDKKPIYQTTHTTFVKGKLNSAFFRGEGLTIRPLPSAIYTVETDRVFFTSVALQANTTDLFKVFSREALTDEQLNSLFGGRNSTFEVVARYPWKAYPKYSPPDVGSTFVLAEGLYYLNGLELGASAIEVSSIAGKNVGNLILRDIARKLI